MGQDIVLFHSALGLRPAVYDFAEALRAAGHTVHTPDLFDGETFDHLDSGKAKRDAVGIEALIGRAQAAVEALPEALVYVGLSMGVGAAEFLAATRPGARGALLIHGAFAPADFGIPAWPAVPVEIHYAIGDPEVDESAVVALEASAKASGAKVAIHRYERGGHLFEDAAYEGFDATAAEQLRQRAIAFVDSL
jgi:dienelactone hydrolase